MDPKHGYLSILLCSNCIILTYPVLRLLTFLLLMTWTTHMHSESSATLNIDMKDVPEYLKCPISNTFLREAVSLPCCKQCVNDTIVRQQLLAGGLKCPLCGAANISTDAVNTVTALYHLLLR